jgi:hypothetical protein
MAFFNRVSRCQKEILGEVRTCLSFSGYKSWPEAVLDLLHETESARRGKTREELVRELA